LIRFANSRGRGKVLFGTDYPVVDYETGIPAVEKLELRDNARRLLLGDAAREVFGLG